MNFKIGASGPLEFLAAYGFVIIAFLAMLFAFIAPLWIWAANIKDHWAGYTKKQRVRAVAWYALTIGVTVLLMWRASSLTRWMG